MTTAAPATPSRSLSARIAGQGALLMAGFGLGQVLSLARNAALGYWLSRGDFGIAAALVVTLQLVDTLTDLGADRLLVQARDGETPQMLAAAHTLLVSRGVLTALVLLFAAAPTAQFLRLEAHTSLFAALALVPFVKGFLHLDQRCRQRHLDNRAFLATEVGSQALALAALPIVLAWNPAPSIVVWLALVQATAAVLLSHWLAGRPWRLGWDRARLARFLAFGWPIWLSAIPLVMVYQADRFLVGRMWGMEALAAYAAAFMVTMVPGLVAAKVGHALMLPLLSAVAADPNRLARRYGLMLEAVGLLAAVYLATFVVAGGALLVLAFGPAYRELGAVAALLAAMWAVRMLQAPPGMALMALGHTRPLLWAGIVRATGLPLAIAAAVAGWPLEAVAAAGIVAEVASLVSVALALRWAAPMLAAPMLAWPTLLRPLLLLPVAGASLAATWLVPSAAGLPATLTLAALVAGLTALAAVAGQPGLRAAALGYAGRSKIPAVLRA